MPNTCREVIAELDGPGFPQPPESVVELAAEIERALPNDARPDVRAWALWRVLLVNSTRCSPSSPSTRKMTPGPARA